MGDRYLVTRTPDRMLRNWGRVQMDTTCMGMFWGKTLWLDVCVVCGVGSWALDPQRGCGAMLDPGVEWARPVCDQLARESPFWIKQHWNGPYELSSPLIHHTSTPIHVVTYSGANSFPVFILNVEWLVRSIFQIITFNGFVIFFYFNFWFRMWCCSLKQFTQKWMASTSISHECKEVMGFIV